MGAINPQRSFVMCRVCRRTHLLRGVAQVNDCTNPYSESLLLDEVPEVVVVDHPSPPNIATQFFGSLCCGPTDSGLARRIAAWRCRTGYLCYRFGAIGDGQLHRGLGDRRLRSQGVRKRGGCGKRECRTKGIAARLHVPIYTHVILLYAL